MELGGQAWAEPHVGEMIRVKELPIAGDRPQRKDLRPTVLGKEAGHAVPCSPLSHLRMSSFAPKLP